MTTNRIQRQRKREARLQRQRVVLRLLGIDISRLDQRAIRWMVRYASGQPMGADQHAVPSSVRREDIATIDRMNRIRQDATVGQGT
jgi:hypothetical protein